MKIKDFSRRMLEILPQCIRGFHSHESNYLSMGKITLPQFWALEYLSRRGTCLMSELADFLNISRPAATGLIDRLIAQKLVIRQVGTNDRRMVKVSITARGKNIVAHIWGEKRRNLEKVFVQISAHDRRQYLDILQKITKILAQKITVIVITLAFSTPLWAEEGLTLKDCYRLALKQSETIGMSEQTIKEAEGRFLQYINKALPQISFETSQKYQNGSGGSAFTLREIPESKFTVTEVIFSGFKELNKIAATRMEAKQYRQEKKRAEQILFTNVSEAFYLLLSYQEEIEALNATSVALIERVDDLQKREKLGRSRPSEVASANAQLSRLQAELESVKSEADVGRQLLEFLTGRSVENISDTPLPEDISLNMEEYFPKADIRPDVLAAQEALNGAKKGVLIATAGFSPTVNAEGNYYTKRVGNASDVDWDTMLTVDVPISSAGETVGKIKEAKAAKIKAELNLSQTKRSALLDIQNTFTKLQSAHRQADALDKALQAAEENFRLQKEDYKFSLVNNLTVLQALTDLQDVKRDYIAAKNGVKRAYWNFKAAIGDIQDDAR